VALIEFDGVTKRYPGAAAPAVAHLDLAIERGEFLTLLGPSGSGKTTTLMMLAGFEPVSAGTIRLDGQPIERLPAHRRGMGLVFQSYSLFPHMTVARNVGFPLSVRGVGRAEAERRVTQALARVRLEAFAERRPQQLSGGQQQRVALARALVYEPPVVLMDEPLAALDKRLREEMQLEIRRLHRELGVTMVFVTHDQGEAMTLSDRVAVFNHGRIEQLGSPQSLYDAPESAFVAGFIGDNNRLRCRLDGRIDSPDSPAGWVGLHALRGNTTHPGSAAGPATSSTRGARLAARPCAALAQRLQAGQPPAEALLCVRPERLSVQTLGPQTSPHNSTPGAVQAGTPPDNPALPARVADLIHQGDHWRLLATLQLDPAGPDAAHAEPVTWTVKLPPNHLPPGLAPGQPIRLGFRPDDAWAFAPDDA
jgi:putative spermidine/putrescine transport system ATP-binding protein